jgi:diphthamide synthase (EF-2-diphthine--ammonia ligase)
MIAAGVRARIACLDPRVLDRGFAGREYDLDLLAELPAGVDPCAENGEFHSFCYGGPMFREPIPIITGEVVERDGFVYADLCPADPPIRS